MGKSDLLNLVFETNFPIRD